MTTIREIIVLVCDSDRQVLKTISSYRRNGKDHTMMHRPNWDDSCCFFFVVCTSQIKLGYFYRKFPANISPRSNISCRLNHVQHRLLVLMRVQINSDANKSPLHNFYILDFPLERLNLESFKFCTQVYMLYQISAWGTKLPQMDVVKVT